MDYICAGPHTAAPSAPTLVTTVTQALSACEPVVGACSAAAGAGSLKLQMDSMSTAPPTVAPTARIPAVIKGQAHDRQGNPKGTDQAGLSPPITSTASAAGGERTSARNAQVRLSIPRAAAA